MSRDLQSKVARQRRELRRMGEQNEMLTISLSVSQSETLFHKTSAQTSGEALKLIRAKLNVTGHGHIFDASGGCVLCQKSGTRLRIEADQCKGSRAQFRGDL